MTPHPGPRLIPGTTMWVTTSTDTPVLFYMPITSWGGEVRNVAILVGIGVNEDGFRGILGICERAKDDEQR